jgi:hypothetical protein
MSELDRDHLRWMAEEVRRSGLDITTITQFQGKRWVMQWLDPYIMLCGS